MNGVFIALAKFVLMLGAMIAVYAAGRRDGRRKGFRKGFFDGERMGYKAAYTAGTLEGARRERQFASGILTDALRHPIGCCCAACRAKVM